MQELVLQVAQAICRAGEIDEWEQLTAPVKALYCDEAVAAIHAVMGFLGAHAKPITEEDLRDT